MGEKIDKAADFIAHEIGRGRDELAQAIFAGSAYVMHPSHEPKGPEQGNQIENDPMDQPWAERQAGRDQGKGMEI